ncbi:uncharacterized protein LOC144655175 isoform X2 [Oculina patagonica]
MKSRVLHPHPTTMSRVHSADIEDTHSEAPRENEDRTELVKSKSSSEDASYLITVFYWWLGISAELAIILVLGTRLNEKIHSFYDILHNISVPDYKEHLELLHFLMHLRGEPIGLSVGGLVVIDKSLALSIVGIIISYLAVLLTLPT